MGKWNIFNSILITNFIIYYQDYQYMNLDPLFSSNTTTTINKIVKYQAKRLGRQNQAFTLKQLGLDIIKDRSNNLLKLIESGRLKLKEAISNSRHQVTFIIQNPSTQTIANISNGTLLVPQFNDSKRQYQTLIAQNSTDFIIKQGKNQLKLKTFCYDKERSSPKEVPYLLSNVRSIFYKQGMTQRQVWQITFNLQKDQIKRIQYWGSHENLLMLDQEKLKAAIRISQQNQRKKQIQKQKQKMQKRKIEHKKRMQQLKQEHEKRMEQLQQQLQQQQEKEIQQLLAEKIEMMQSQLKQIKRMKQLFQKQEKRIQQLIKKKKDNYVNKQKNQQLFRR